MKSHRFLQTVPFALSFAIPMVIQAQDHTVEQVPSETTLRQRQERESLLTLRDPKELENRIKSLSSLKALNSEERDELLEIYFNGRKFGFGPAFRAESVLSDLEPDFAFEAARKVLFQDPPASAEKRVDAIRLLRRRNVEKSLSKLSPAEVQKLFKQLDTASSSNDWGLRYNQGLLLKDMIPFHRERIESEVSNRLSDKNYRQNPAVEQLFELAEKLPRRLSPQIISLHLQKDGVEPRARILSSRTALVYLGNYQDFGVLDDSIQKQIRDLNDEKDIRFQLDYVRTLSNLTRSGQGNFLDLLLRGAQVSGSNLNADYIYGLDGVIRSPRELVARWEELSPDDRRAFQKIVIADLSREKPRLSDRAALNFFVVSRVYSHPKGLDEGRKQALNELLKMGISAKDCSAIIDSGTTCSSDQTGEGLVAVAAIAFLGPLGAFLMARDGISLSAEKRNALASAMDRQ